MSTFLKRVFAIMFGAVGVSALTSYATLRWGLWLVVGAEGLSPLFYIAMFVGLGLSIFAQVRAFEMKAGTGRLLLGIYAVLMGFVMTPLVAYAAAINPESIMQAFFVAALMFACMALFGYKTVKDLSFLGTFLFIGMMGLMLTGFASFVWPLGETASTIWSAAAVLVFALFTAYDMQFLKRVYNSAKDDGKEGQLAVLGALHLYISFIVMFENVLSLLNSRR
ncbi:MAG: Bax inhibitor-1/YccA family protein [Rickettsiales bacterium]|jgi:FtsH-binding integral membrane protein|nr:Bax inhibitor-1/YccA family protein [Rickettsiales bacterium]